MAESDINKKNKDQNSGESDSDRTDSSQTPKRPDPAASIDQIQPGTPWGVAKPHYYTHVRHMLQGAGAIGAAYVRLELSPPLKKRVLGFLGNFGSGKTEVAVNFAMQLGLASMRHDDPFTGPVRIADLDIINTYFRSREAATPLMEAGVEVVSPGGDKFWADLPIILPEIKGLLKRTDGTLILDVGGDDLGARALSHLSQDFPIDDYTLMMVVNANRPFTSDLAGAKKVLRELEDAAGLKIGGLVSNTHLMDETEPDEIRRGYKFTKKMSEEIGIPLLMVAVEPRLMGGLRKEEFDCVVLPLSRFMLPPWRSGL
jgi:hypothetical protein